MTLQEIKDNYAKGCGYSDWEDLVGQESEGVDYHWGEVCLLAQKQALENAYKSHSIKMAFTFNVDDKKQKDNLEFLFGGHTLIKESITDESNLVI